MLIKAVFESFARAVIRYFDSKVVSSDEVHYLRAELEKQRLENFKLTKFILEPKAIEQPVDDEPVDWKPAREFKSWTQKRAELEQASLIRANQLKQEAQAALAQKAESLKSTAELEAELLGED